MVEPVKGYVTSNGLFFKDQKTADLVEAYNSLRSFMSESVTATHLIRNADKVVTALRPVIQYAKDERKLLEDMSKTRSDECMWDAHDSITALLNTNIRR